MLHRLALDIDTCESSRVGIRLKGVRSLSILWIQLYFVIKACGIWFSSEVKSGTDYLRDPHVHQSGDSWLASEAHEALLCVEDAIDLALNRPVGFFLWLLGSVTSGEGGVILGVFNLCDGRTFMHLPLVKLGARAHGSVRCLRH